MAPAVSVLDRPWPRLRRAVLSDPVQDWQPRYLDLRAGAGFGGLVCVRGSLPPGVVARATISICHPAVGGSGGGASDGERAVLTGLDGAARQHRAMAQSRRLAAGHVYRRVQSCSGGDVLF